MTLHLKCITQSGVSHFLDNFIKGTAYKITLAGHTSVITAENGVQYPVDLREGFDPTLVWMDATFQFAPKFEFVEGT